MRPAIPGSASVYRFSVAPALRGKGNVANQIDSAATASRAAIAESAHRREDVGGRELPVGEPERGSRAIRSWVRRATFSLPDYAYSSGENFVAALLFDRLHCTKSVKPLLATKPATPRERGSVLLRHADGLEPATACVA